VSGNRASSLRVIAVTIVLIVALAAAGLTFLSSEDEPGDDLGRIPEPKQTQRVFASDDPLERACAMPVRYLKRLVRGYHPVHSEDVTIVPNEPNFVGSFEVTSHSGPWDYLQRIPLVLYGPGRIAASDQTTRAVDLTDVYPTVDELIDIDLPERDGAVLQEALDPAATGRPKLVLTIVWDGVGRNTLRVWPDEWPTLARMMKNGTSYSNAIVGSSPSITPSSHASLGTGTFTPKHGVPSIHYRTADGETRGTLERQDPSDLQLTTFADEADLALGNEPKVGLISYNTWHIAMLGKGLSVPGGDADLAGIINYRVGGQMVSNPDFYSLPDYLVDFPGLEEHAEELDRSDGQADGRWMGRDVLAKQDNPAWTNFQLDATLAAWEREGFGDDEVTDFFFSNFKQTDLAGHSSTIDSPQMKATLKAQDDALAEMLAYLDREVGDYVVIFTSDHGHTRSPEITGAWPVGGGNLERDLQAHFEIPADEPLLTVASAYGLYLDYEVADRYKVGADDVARFLNSYTIEDNWAEGELPDGYESRKDEQTLAAAFPTKLLPRALRCAQKRAAE
jgi:hypothetical protein